jgi:hypothetical protein
VADPALTAVVTAMMDDTLTALSDAVAETWRSVPDLSDTAATRAVGNVVPLVSGAQRAVAALNATYVTRVTELPLGAPQVATLRPEADWNYSPMIQARTLVSRGMEFAIAIDTAARRAAQVHTGDVLRARGDATTALSVGVEPLRPIRWAKVPGPTACSWCRTVSTQLYTRPDGLPVHLHDRCGLNAITPGEAGSYTNASTVFQNTRWRSRVSTTDLAKAQQAMAAEATRLAAAANAKMARRAA